jgi:hypothetical protein
MRKPASARHGVQALALLLVSGLALAATGPSGAQGAPSTEKDPAAVSFAADEPQCMIEPWECGPDEPQCMIEPWECGPDEPQCMIEPWECGPDEPQCMIEPWECQPEEPRCIEPCEAPQQPSLPSVQTGSPSPAPLPIQAEEPATKDLGEKQCVKKRRLRASRRIDRQPGPRRQALARARCVRSAT